MALYSKHPVSPPPTPPARERTGHLMLRAWVVFVLFSAFAGPAWVNAFGPYGAAVVAIGGGIVSVAVWLRMRPPLAWRRLPWYVVTYVAWATASLAWSAWPATTALTLLLLLITTLQAVFIGSALTWSEVVRSIASALMWVLALSILFELFVSLVIHGPVLPGFATATGPVDPIVYWSRDNLFAGGRIQGIMGNANLLGPVALLAMVVFGIRYAAAPPRRTLLLVWIALAGYLFFRAASATAFVAAAAVAIVLTTVLLMRTVRRPGGRTRYYIGYALLGLGGGTALWVWRDDLFSTLGRSADLTGREDIWAAVLERAGERPVAGWGFASPWMPWEASFDGWIIDHDQTVMQAHSVWIDVYLQLGIIGLVLFGALMIAYVWRAWFFAVDRPRWDLRADRPYSPLTLLPTLLGAILLVQGVAESSPLILWGWMLLVLLGAKIKQSPLIGVGPAEQSAAIERGEPARYRP